MRDVLTELRPKLFKLKLQAPCGADVASRVAERALRDAGLGLPPRIKVRPAGALAWLVECEWEGES